MWGGGGSVLPGAGCGGLRAQKGQSGVGEIWREVGAGAGQVRDPDGSEVTEPRVTVTFSQGYWMGH